VILLAAALQAAVPGEPACAEGRGPAILAELTDLKDRRGTVKLELYPATKKDWLEDDRDLWRRGRFFHRVEVAVPSTGRVRACMRVPYPGRYALLVTHNRDGRNKFSFWIDGLGLPGNAKLGRARPKLEHGLVEVGGGVLAVTMRAQYLRGLAGFGSIR
jgi:uncharacterized protein (DUF2141 family)